MTAPLLSVNALSLSYGERRVLNRCSLTLSPGERVVVVGTSGSGKTSILRCIAGLQPTDEGTIALRGVPATEGRRILLSPWRRDLQMVFQGLALWPQRTVRGNLLAALAAARIPKAEAKTRAAQVLERIGLEPLADARPATLSGGEARRLAFARALVLEPSLLLLDEPFSSLDPLAKEDGFTLLNEVLSSSGAALLFVTHDPAEAKRVGGSVVFLRGGALSDPIPAAELPTEPDRYASLLAER